MQRKSLIISDNSNIYRKIYEILSSKELVNKFEFGISPFSKKDDFDSSVHIFNMKDKDDISYLSNSYDLIFSVHCKQIFPDSLINEVKCINIHPGYNPINRGWYPQVFSIINDTIIGATIHEINSELDGGPIIVREEIEKYYFDTSETLYNRVVEKELELFSKWISKILLNNYITYIPNDCQNLYLKKDYDNLKEIKLDKKVTYLDAINHLRAMTHGDFRNAYFIDPTSGEKIYIKITLEK